MNSAHLKEHDANQGAQSSGEFLGMTGNSGWYLLGSGGATIMMVIFLWGVLGVSLLLCLFIGFVLCLASIAYVFTLKNNKPEHYDTDFFESALIEAGVFQFSFGPRPRRPLNPFTVAGDAETVPEATRKAILRNRSTARIGSRSEPAETKATTEEPVKNPDAAKPTGAKQDAVVTRGDYDRLQEKLSTTEELLEDVLAEAAEE